MERNPSCLTCGIDLRDKVKDRTVLVSAKDVVPLWKDILQKKLTELNPDAELSPSQIDAILESAKVEKHGLICKKCFNAYSRLHKELSTLGEKMTKVVSSGLIDCVIVTSARVGQKRKPGQDTQDQPPAKSLCHSFPS